MTTRMCRCHRRVRLRFLQRGVQPVGAEHGQLNVHRSKASAPARRCCSIPAKWEYGSNIDWSRRSWRTSPEAARRGHAGADSRPARYDKQRLRPDAVHALPPRTGSAAARGRGPTSLPDFELPQDPRSTWVATGSIRWRARLRPVHPHVAERWRAEHGRVLEGRRCSWPRRTDSANGISGCLPGVIARPLQRRRVLPRHAQVLGADLHDQRRGGADGAPAGRSAWAGLPNLFYWIDRRNGVGGFWATQVFPFADPASFTGYMDFETAVYDSRRGRGAA